MTTRFVQLMALSTCLYLAVSCGGEDDSPILAGNTQQASQDGEALYTKAKAIDEAGKHRSAIKKYDQLANKYPFAPSASKARFRQAQLLEQAGETEKSFEAYEKFLNKYQASNLYTEALEHQAKMAQAAAEGDVKSSFLGLKTRISVDKTVKMLSSVRDSAPRSYTSAKAQFTIGELYQGNKKHKEAIEAYRKLVRDQPESSFAPEALFRIGVILLEEADRGNRNQATLDLSREAFSDYLIQYPGHSKNAEARKLSQNIDGRQLGRYLEIAEFYDKTGQYESAKIYYRKIVKAANSGAAYEQAKARIQQLGN